MARETEERSAGGDSDRQLLRRFARAKDEAAFEEIVRRHGPLVLGVCRRVIGPGHEAEDAFQATFLVLATSAGKIRKRASLASWLYGVAYRVALKELRKKYAVREEPLGEVVAAEENPLEEVSRRHDEHVVDEELYALAEKYRRPLVLHYLEGRANQEIADELGLSLSAVEGRLKRAKVQLRRRLIRRGVTLSVLGVLIASTQQTARAQVAESLIHATVESSVSFAAGEVCGDVASHVLAQSEVLAMASATRTVGMFAAATLLATCVGVWSLGSLVAGKEPVPPADPLSAAADGPGEEESLATAVVGMADPSKDLPLDPSDPSGSSQYREAVRRIEAALNQPFDTTGIQGSLPLEDVARAFSQQLRVPVVIDRRALEDVGFSPDMEVEIPVQETGLLARSVLRLTFNQYDLTYTLTDQVLLITTPEEAETRMDTRVYSTAGLPAQAEQWIDVITATISPTTWSDVGGPGEIRLTPDGSGLVIMQAQEVHEQIADLLRQLRENADTPPPAGGGFF